MLALTMDDLMQLTAAELAAVFTRRLPPQVNELIAPEQIAPLAVVLRTAGPDAWDKAQLLVDRGADWAQSDPRGYTPLHWLLMGHLPGNEFSPEQHRLLDWLLDLHAHSGRPLPQSQHGRTLLHTAASLPDPAPLRRLLAEGLDVHAQDVSGLTALHTAYKNACAPVASALIAAGADPEVRDHRGKRPMDLLGQRQSMGKKEREAFDLDMIMSAQPTRKSVRPRL